MSGVRIRIVDSLMSPISGVSVQMYILDPDNGIIPIYASVSDKGGIFIPLDGRIIGVLQDWSELYGKDFSFVIRPHLLFSFTIVDERLGQVFYDIKSIELTSNDISNIFRKTFRKDVILIVGRDIHWMPMDIYWNSSKNHELEAIGPCIPTNSGYLPTIKCHETLGCPYDYGEIPVAYLEASPASWGIMSYAFGQEETIEFNLGIALDPFGLTEFKIGPTLFSTNLYFMRSFTIQPYNTEWVSKYIYIMGKIEGALYELGVLNHCDQGNCYYDCLDEYKYISSIIAINRVGSELIGGIGYGDPQFLSIVGNEFIYDFYDVYQGRGSVDGTYMISNIDLRSRYISQNFNKLGIAIPVGALLAVAGFDTIPVTKLITLIASISTVNTVFVISWCQFDSYQDYDIYVDVYITRKVYDYGSSLVNIPLMNIKLYSYPPRR